MFAILLAGAGMLKLVNTSQDLQDMGRPIAAQHPQSAAYPTFYNQHCQLRPVNGKIKIEW